MSESLDRHLHFHVRHDRYEQTIGYGYFMNRVLSRLNEEKPRNAKELLERTAMLMLNPLDEDNLSVRPSEQQKRDYAFIDCLPEKLKRRRQEISSYIQTYGIEELIGPAAAPVFGLLNKTFVAYNKQLYAGGVFDPKTGMTGTSAAFGAPLVTSIITDGEAYRGYADTLAENYGVHLDSLPEDFKLEFYYPIPSADCGENLPLMKIGSPRLLENDFRSLCGGDQRVVNNTMVLPFLQHSLVFLHPDSDEGYFAKLVQCIDPLLQTIDTPPLRSVSANEQLPDDKLDAVTTIYWLLGQTTPVVRGGSGYANVILEHVAYRLREQGYDYEIPYTKVGVDLWAQAATLPLEDTVKLKGFKSRFKEGLFFDINARDEDVEQYIDDRLPNNRLNNILRGTTTHNYVEKPPRGCLNLERLLWPIDSLSRILDYLDERMHRQ